MQNLEPSRQLLQLARSIQAQEHKQVHQAPRTRLAFARALREKKKKTGERACVKRVSVRAGNRAQTDVSRVISFFLSPSLFNHLLRLSSLPPCILRAPFFFGTNRQSTAWRNLPKLCSFWLAGTCTRVVQHKCPFRPCNGMFEFPEIAATHRDLRAALIDRLKKVRSGWAAK